VLVFTPVYYKIGEKKKGEKKALMKYNETDASTAPASVTTKSRQTLLC